MRWQAIHLGLIRQHEETVQATDDLLLSVHVGTDALLLERRDTRVRNRPQLVDIAEADRIGGACLRAGRLEVVLEPIVAERALVCLAIGAHVDDVEGACGNAGAASIADILLDEDAVELGPDDGARGTDLEAAGLNAVLADV